MPMDDDDDPVRVYPAGLPLPARITAALNLRQLYGPQVDLDCLAREPDVDNWEAGSSVPRPEQLAALAALTHLPVAFFFQPDDGPVAGAWVCHRTKQQGSRCRYVEPVADVVVAADARLSPVRYTQGDLFESGRPR